jgi:hypothetical protein
MRVTNMPGGAAWVLVVVSVMPPGQDVMGGAIAGTDGFVKKYFLMSEFLGWFRRNMVFVTAKDRGRCCRQSAGGVVGAGRLLERVGWSIRLRRCADASEDGGPVLLGAEWGVRPHNTQLAVTSEAP